MFILSYKADTGDVVTRACGDVQVFLCSLEYPSNSTCRLYNFTLTSGKINRVHLAVHMYMYSDDAWMWPVALLTDLLTVTMFKCHSEYTYTTKMDSDKQSPFWLRA